MNQTKNCFQFSLFLAIKWWRISIMITRYALSSVELNQNHYENPSRKDDPCFLFCLKAADKANYGISFAYILLTKSFFSSCLWIVIQARSWLYLHSNHLRLRESSDKGKFSEAGDTELSFLLKTSKFSESVNNKRKLSTTKTTKNDNQNN